MAIPTPANFVPDLKILNSDLYDTTDIEVNFYQQRLKWPWRRGDWHALGTVFFALGVIAIYGLLNLHDLRLDRNRLRIATHNRRNRNEPPLEWPERSLYDRISTHMRNFAYLRTQRLAHISIGMCVLIIGLYMYPVLYIFTQKPYYAFAPELGPPPLAGRAGMMAAAMIPFVIALGMKVNLVSAVTGVGHEKLNVLHRWTGMLLGFCSVVHAVPFIVEPVIHGGWAEVREKFGNHPTYWNGVGAIVCLAWLCIASLPFIRAWCYEVFVQLHIFFGVAFLGLMFWHCNNQLSSWHYLFATCIIWLGCLTYRLIFKTNFIRNFHGEKAHISLLSDEGVKISIATTLRWKAGQHVFIRIPAISWLGNHPFTVASFPEREEGEHNDLLLVFKPQKGFTKRVHEIASKDPDNSLTAYLDGPYGGLARPLESFETVVLIAGGSGITPIIGHLAELARNIRAKQAVTRDVRIIWTVKRFESLEWFKDSISKIARTMPRNSLLVQYFITQETPVPLPVGPVSATREWPASPRTPRTPQTPVFPKAEPMPARRQVIVPDEKEYELNVLAMRKELGHPTPRPPPPPPPPPIKVTSDDLDSQPHAITTDTPTSNATPSPFDDPSSPASDDLEDVKKLPPLGDEVLLEFGRPPLREALRKWSEGFGKRTCIYVCGPAGMKVDVANAVSECQNDVWYGSDSNEDSEREEVYLHTETFGW